MWIVYAARIAGRPLRKTVTGRLLLPAVAARAARDSLAIALIGAGPGVAPETAARLRTQNAQLAIVAAITPPMDFEINSDADRESVERLKASGASVIFVALGAPKQELWMERHRGDLPGVVLIGVGAAFDIIAGRFREAPRWMTRIGTEWLFRLAQEPRRLARRYLVDDPWIVLWAVRARLGMDRESRETGS
jgi:N-acetylglucosaminyldiphosphoundecaprenol N-acetyl-beta-D-mannosaminyltransferase